MPDHNLSVDFEMANFNHRSYQNGGKYPNKESEVPNAKTLCACFGNSKKCRKTWKRDWHEYSQKTTFHGVRYIYDRESSNFRK